MSVRIEVRATENVDSALRRLRRLCSKSGIRRGRRARRYYEKPCERRRREARERLRTIRKAELERR